MARAAQQLPQLTKRERKRLMKRQKKKKRGRERGLARARWAGLRRATVQRGTSSWVCAVGDQRIKRAAALVAATVNVDSVLRRRVWLELVNNFYWWQVSRGVVEQTALIESKGGGSGGGSGDRVSYDLEVHSVWVGRTAREGWMHYMQQV